MPDTLFADVSEFQAPVDDSYPYQVLSIRTNDGTYLDHKFWQNYPWMRQNLDSGRLVAGIVYCYCRTNWDATAQSLIDMINNNGGLHPRVALMLDVESGGNPTGDQSDWINKTYWKLAEFAGDPRRIIGYANAWDFYNMWPTRPDGLQVIGAGYGSDPHLIGQLAHQYSDGVYGCGGDTTPCGCPPFGNCDMNSADGLDPFQMATRMGIGAVGPAPTPGGNVTDQQVQEIWDQLRVEWPQLGGQTLVDALAQVRVQLLGPGADNNAPNAGTLGWPQLGGHTLVDALALLLGQPAKATVTEQDKTPSRAQEHREERAKKSTKSK